MNSFWKRITSRKFLAAAAGIIVGVALIFGADEGVITSVSGAVTALASVLSYIITEGKIDAASIIKAVDAVETITDIIIDKDENTEAEG